MTISSLATAATDTSRPAVRPLRAVFAIPAVALTVCIMAYSGLMGPFGILLLYAIWFPLILVKGVGVVWPPQGSRFALAFVALCCASVVWSPAHAVTLRAALELATMVAVAFIVTRTVPTIAYVKGLMAGICLVLLASLANGTYGVDAFSGTTTLVGLFGSKNQLGYFAELGVFLAIVLALEPRRWLAKALYVPPVLLLGLLCLYRSHSGTSLLSLAVTLVALAGFFAISGLGPRLRAGLVICGAILLPVLAIAAFSLGLQDLVLHGLGKDTTLTGRTLLWAEGLKQGMLHPVQGLGYQAFWVPGNPEAEQLWYQFFITGRSGFHFHDTYIEAFVELGIVGLSILAAWMATTVFKSVRAVVLYGIHLETTLPLGISIMLLVRSFVEVDILGPFGMGWLLFLPILPKLAGKAHAAK